MVRAGSAVDVGSVVLGSVRWGGEGRGRETGQMELWSTEAGEQLAFDGVFYSYRSADGLSAFKLWTPPGKGPVRALLLFGNPGGGFGGDTRDKSRQ